MQGGRRGVTLIEILIVVTVFAIVAAMAMPWILGVIEAYRLRVAAWELAGDLRLARQKAVSTQVRHRVCLSNCASAVPPGGYLLEREGTPVWELDVVRSDLPDGVAITDNTGGKFTFEAKGGVNGGTATLSSTAGTYQVRTASSGRVRVCKGICP
ncbi:MAG: Tfp pilus assembly protein FimT/FimU [Candidatus Methylomirabilales bacterium]